MELTPLGDAAYLVRDVPEAAATARWLQEANLPGLLEAVAAYDTIGLYVDPDRFDASSFAIPTHVPTVAGKRIEIPVVYDGEDLEAAAEALRITQAELIAIHSGTTYTCFAIGFSPGFPYLGYLPDRIATLPRRSVPRIRVPAGSVAIAGRQTGIYPQERPGGWWLLGHTDVTLVDLDRDQFLIEAGDSVKFRPV